MIRRRALLVAALVAASAPVLAQTPSPTPVDPKAVVPVEAFAELPRLESPSLSPDGTRIAGKMAINGVQNFVVVSLFDDTPPAAAKVGPDMDVNWWRWVGNDWLAAGIGRQVPFEGEDVYMTRMLGIRADMRAIKPVDWAQSGFRADTLLWTARDGSPRVVFARQTGIDHLEDVYPRSGRQTCRPARPAASPPARPTSGTGTSMVPVRCAWGCATTMRAAAARCSTAPVMPSPSARSTATIPRRPPASSSPPRSAPTAPPSRSTTAKGATPFTKCRCPT
ncbi:MAG: hypothetical protein ACK4ZY_07495 [Sphingomonas sp.]